MVCQDVLEELDPSIEPVLSKAIIKQGNREVVRLGDKELDWSHDFRLYITTKLGNPHYTPEVNDDAFKMPDMTESQTCTTLLRIFTLLEPSCTVDRNMFQNVWH